MGRSHKTTLQGVCTTRPWSELVTASQPKVEKIQRRIYRESLKGDLRRVHQLQRLLATSFSAKVVAVENVTQTPGSNTPGIDGMLYKTTPDKITLALDLNFRKYKPSPTRRVTIPKSQGGIRTLGIPTIRDRAHQALVLLAMEPEWEARFEPNSYGFRPGRNAHQAVKAISDLLHKNIKQYGDGQTPHEKADQIWILDADIAQCFDNIDHQALLSKINTSSPFHNIINKWLKAGTITDIGFQRTEKGTPQGGVISPLLANIALHGMEELFGIYSETTKNNSPKDRKYLPPSMRRGKNKGIALVRYADDLVVIARARSENLMRDYVKPKLATFLHSIGLEMKEAKTKIITSREGFSFLGFRFRYREDMANTTYWPDQDRIIRALEKLNQYIQGRRAITGTEMPTFIMDINRRIQGIIRYYGWSRAWGTIGYIGHRLWEMMYKWALRQHPKRGKKWVRKHCFSQKPWETFDYRGCKVLVPYLYWRQMTKGVNWWGIKQIRINSSPYDLGWKKMGKEKRPLII
jgi:RNA-directed DNA polymerase